MRIWFRRSQGSRRLEICTLHAKNLERWCCLSFSINLRTGIPISESRNCLSGCREQIVLSLPYRHVCALSGETVRCPSWWWGQNLYKTFSLISSRNTLIEKPSRLHIKNTKRSNQHGLTYRPKTTPKSLQVGSILHKSKIPF